MRIPLSFSARARHPLLQVLSLLLGVALLGVLLVFGAAVLAVMAAVGTAVFGWRRWRRTRMPARPGSRADNGQDVLEGEFVVIHSRRSLTH